MATIHTADGKTAIQLTLTKMHDGTTIIDLPHVLEVPVGAKLTFISPDSECIVRDLTSRFDAPNARITSTKRNTEYLFHLAHAADDFTKRYWVNATKISFDMVMYCLEATYARCFDESRIMWIVGPFETKDSADIFLPPSIIQVADTRYNFVARSDSRTVGNSTLFMSGSDFLSLEVNSCLFDAYLFSSQDNEILSSVYTRIVYDQNVRIFVNAAGTPLTNASGKLLAYITT